MCTHCFDENLVSMARLSQPESLTFCILTVPFWIIFEVYVSWLWLILAQVTQEDKLFPLSYFLSFPYCSQLYEDQSFFFQSPKRSSKAQLSNKSFLVQNLMSLEKRKYISDSIFELHLILLIFLVSITSSFVI